MTQDGGMRAYGPLFLLGALLMGATGRRAEAASPTPDEMGLRRGWVEASFGATPPKAPPFSFRYGGVGSAAFLDAWTFARDTAKLDGTRTRYTLGCA